MRAANPITLRGVRKSYGSVVALRDVDLEITSGEFVTLLGPSGSGKTTLLMIIAGFTRPDAGSIRIGEREVVLVPPHKRDIGLVFQSYALFPHMSVGENVAFPLRYRHVGRSEMADRVRRALDLVRLSGFEDRRVHELSGGQSQRVALARALVFEPAILLMDEPLSALDKKLRENMQVELRNLHARLGTTTVYVTHDQREALTMSTRIAVMNAGSVVQVGAPLDIYERPRNHFVADFMGESQFLAVDYARDGVVRLNGAVLRTTRLPPWSEQQHHLLVRPEKVEIVSARAEANDLNTFDGRVVDVLYQGEDLLIAVKLDGGQQIHVRRPTAQATMRNLPSRDQELTLGIHPADSVIVAEQ